MKRLHLRNVPLPNPARLLRRSKRHVPGTPPGTIRYDPEAPKPVIHALCYDEHDFQEHTITRVEDIPPLIERWPVTWINVDGLGDAYMIQALGDLFGIHRLALEDVVNTHQRAKMEEYDHVIYLVARMLRDNAELETEQVSIFLGDRFVLTFLEDPGDCLDPVRKRIREARGRIRRQEADYLAYCLLDAIIDDYFPHIDLISESLENLEDQVLEAPAHDAHHQIHALRRDLLTLRRAVSPLREAVNSLIRDTGNRITDDTRIHLRDCYDHTFQIIDLVESQREVAGALLDVYLSSVNNRMNEIMKVLTIMATLFIPLTFIVGLYGMNFSHEASRWNMPELYMEYGYPVLLLVMLGVVVVELIAFRRLGWLGGSRKRRK
jgi:magnesium transporter